MSVSVAIIGAGLSGLACGLELQRQGTQVTIFEAESEIGGRVRTDSVDGFLLDHGFQVFLPSYELGPRFLDYSELGLKPFSSGAKIYKNGRFHEISDPLRNPTKIWQTLFSSIPSIKDKLLIMKFIFMRKVSYQDLRGAKGGALVYLQDFGFSQKFIQSFFIPFFSGVFLDRELSVSKDFLRYLFQKFSEASACLPSRGMQRIPLQMASQIGFEKIKLNQKVDFNTFDRKKFDHLVWANAASIEKSSSQEYNEVTTHYYKTRSDTFASKTLCLNGENDAIVNHVACLTAVNPEYAPKGWHLFSVNCLKESSLSQVEKQLNLIFGEGEISQWELIKSYVIKKALPKQPHYGQVSILNAEGIFLCGDHMESPSIQGALQSGLRVAQEILQLSNSV